MFSENLKTIRKAKGYTQEELAIKIHVVRQTVSKWEKGLSVPDADALTKIADVLEVSVSELLGAEMKEEINRNEVAEQLAKVNEQLTIKSKRIKLVWKIIGIILIIGLALSILCYIIYAPVKTSVSGSDQVIENIDEEYIDEE